MKSVTFLLILFVSFSMFTQEDKKTIVQEIPIYPGCEKVLPSKRGICMNKKIKKIIHKNFDISLANKLNLKARKCIKYAKRRKIDKRRCIKYEPKKYKVILAFKISENGDITKIKVDASHNKLKKEAERIAKLIPKIKPGKLNGKPVEVGYTVPFSFIVE